MTRTRQMRALWVAPAFLAVAVLGFGAAGAADKTKVDQATKQVEQGAKQIGSGSVGWRARGRSWPAGPPVPLRLRYSPPRWM